MPSSPPPRSSNDHRFLWFLFSLFLVQKEYTTYINMVKYRLYSHLRSAASVQLWFLLPMCCPHSIRVEKREILTISLTRFGTRSQAVARAHISEGSTQSWGCQLTQLFCTTTVLYSSNICYLFESPWTIIHPVFSDSSQRTAFLIHPSISSRHRLFWLP